LQCFIFLLLFYFAFVSVEAARDVQVSMRPGP
jgi:hypothetical protein